MAQRKKKQNTKKLKVVMLGGLSEIGKNLAVIEYENEMIVVDCGIGFPDDEMPGVDLVLPDFTYLKENADKLKGVFITHGHEDHVGGVPYLLKLIDTPVFGTKLSIGIIKNKLREHNLDYTPELVPVEAGDSVKVGNFTVEFIRVNHSIADSCCLAIRTPAGTVLHSGDFKLDTTPVDGEIMDLNRLSQIGSEGVLLLMCESTNVEHPGYTPSERTVGEALDNIFRHNTDKRLIISTFSSNVHRVQQIINKSALYGRKVAITGRSMLNIVSAAVELGYMTFPENTLIDISEIRKFNPEQLTIISTGAQGEPMSALYRMVFGEHDKVQLGPKDLVIISAHTIPGNEKLVDKIINELYRTGIAVYRDSSQDVHVSGHACREEIKLMHALTRPKYFMPIHGECKHLYEHKVLAMEMGMPPDRIFVSEIGKVLEVSESSAGFNGTVPSGVTLIDGSGIGDVGSIVLRDRKHLSEDGLIVVVAVINDHDMSISAGPDIISRGFVYMKESEELMNDLKSIAFDSLSDSLDAGLRDFTQIKGRLKDDLSKAIYQRTKRKPMVLPVIMNL
ncbi:MAG TPA: ribonuclease J [Clostridiales bacterium]|nr:ribonuclease J [Clostridiales bacterium]